MDFCVSRQFIFFLYSIIRFPRSDCFPRVNSNREISVQFCHICVRVVHFTTRSARWLLASFAIVYARFFERGSRTVIIRFHPPIQEEGNVPTSARPTRTLRGDVSCLESTESTVSRSSLCTNKKSAVHGERRNSGAFHAIVPLASTCSSR